MKAKNRPPIENGLNFGEPAGWSNVDLLVDPHRRAAAVARRAVQGFGKEVTAGESPASRLHESKKPSS
jgi:hypothetical protein